MAIILAFDCSLLLALYNAEIIYRTGTCNMRYLWLPIAALVFSVNCLAQGSRVELDALLLESNSLLQEGRSEEALALLERNQERFSSYPEYLNNLAVALLGNQQPEKAMALLRGLVESDPVFNIVTHNLLELELLANPEPSDTMNPILFVQSVDSFFEEGLAQMADEALSDERAAASPLAGSSMNNGDEIDLTSRNNAIRDALIRITQGWAQAWSNKNLERYLAYYTENYRPDDRTSHPEWIANRASALGKPGEIAIELDNLDVQIAAEQVMVRFDQSYRSSNYSDRVRKTLVYSFTENGWRISQETSVPLN